MTISWTRAPALNMLAEARNHGGGGWDDEGRRLRVGGDPVVVRVTTSNGPVTVMRR